MPEGGTSRNGEIVRHVNLGAAGRCPVEAYLNWTEALAGMLAVFAWFARTFGWLLVHDFPVS